MNEIGVRELKAHASEIMRAVRETRATYTVTHRGRPVGVIMPLPLPEATQKTGDEVWAELDRLGDEITRGWKSPKTSGEILSEMRR